MSVEVAEFGFNYQLKAIKDFYQMNDALHVGAILFVMIKELVTNQKVIVTQNNLESPDCIPLALTVTNIGTIVDASSFREVDFGVSVDIMFASELHMRGSIRPATNSYVTPYVPNYSEWALYLEEDKEWQDVFEDLRTRMFAGPVD